MSSFLKDFNYDSSKASDGVWFPEEDASFLIGHVAEIDFLSMISKEQDKIKAKSQLKDKQVTESQILDITLDLTVKHRLLGWKGIADVNGNEVEYSQEKAGEMLRISKKFQTFVTSKSQNLENFYKDKRSKTVKK